MECVYEIININNGKKYIGSTVNYHKRRLGHKASLRGGYHDNRLLQKDFDVYGEDSFQFKVVKETSTEEERFALEEELIQRQKTYVTGYNLTVDGRGKYIITAETRQRMRENTMGENNPFYGKTHTEESLKIMSQKARERTGPKNPFYGKTHSQETLDKIARSFKKLKDSGWISPQKGVPKTPEANRNNALAQPTRKPVHAGGREYISISECAKDLGVVNTTVNNRVKSDKYPDYYFIDN